MSSEKELQSIEAKMKLLLQGQGILADKLGDIGNTLTQIRKNLSDSRLQTRLGDIEDSLKALVRSSHK